MSNNNIHILQSEFELIDLKLHLLLCNIIIHRFRSCEETLSMSIFLSTPLDQFDVYVNLIKKIFNREVISFRLFQTG